MTLGLQNNLNRWYDSTVGRWMSKDQIGFYGLQTNLYVYCGNSPTNATDPTGCYTTQQLLDRYNFLKSHGFSGGALIKAMIVDALIMCNGNVTAALGLVQNLRNIPGGPGPNDDVLAAVDHFLQSWALRGQIPFGPIAGIGASVANDGYSFLKLIGYPVGRDYPNSPPSRLTWQQYKWGNIGSWAAFWYTDNLAIGSPEWRSFLEWLDKQF